jgi:hypothetical protein
MRGMLSCFKCYRKSLMIDVLRDIVGDCYTTILGRIGS